jgi:nitric oxide reductase subunit B
LRGDDAVRHYGGGRTARVHLLRAHDGLLLNKLDFSVAKMLHIDTMIIWLRWASSARSTMVPADRAGRETEGAVLAEIMFWIFCAAVAVVAAVFHLRAVWSGSRASLRFINQGRKYVEAPRCGGARHRPGGAGVRLQRVATAIRPRITGASSV